MINGIETGLSLEFLEKRIYHKKTFLKSCRACKKEFLSEKRSTVYCGEVCREESRQENLKRAYLHYKERRSIRTHTSAYRAQSRRYHRERRVRKDPNCILGANGLQYKRICLYCDMEFITANHRIGFCSDKCRRMQRLAQSKMQREKYQMLAAIARMGSISDAN